MIQISGTSTAFTQSESSNQEVTTNKSWNFLMSDFDLNQTCKPAVAESLELLRNSLSLYLHWRFEKVVKYGGF